MVFQSFHTNVYKRSPMETLFQIYTAVDMVYMLIWLVHWSVKMGWDDWMEERKEYFFGGFTSENQTNKQTNKKKVHYDFYPVWEASYIPPWRGVPSTSHQEETSKKTQDTLKGLRLLLAGKRFGLQQMSWRMLLELKSERHRTGPFTLWPVSG